MKKQIWTLAFFFVSAVFTFSFGQIQKRSKYVNGGLIFNVSTTPFETTINETTVINDYNYLRFRVQPEMGFFITDKLALGGIIGYTYTSSIPEDQFINSGETIYHSYQIGVAPRYYHLLNKKFGLLARGAVSFNQTEQKTKLGLLPEIISTHKSLEYSIRSGIVYFVSDHFGLEATFGSIEFTHQFDKGDFGDGNIFNLELNSSLAFGFSYYFGFDKNDD